MDFLIRPKAAGHDTAFLVVFGNRVGSNSNSYSIRFFSTTSILETRYISFCSLQSDGTLGRQRKFCKKTARILAGVGNCLLITHSELIEHRQRIRHQSLDVNPRQELSLTRLLKIDCPSRTGGAPRLMVAENRARGALSV